MPHCPWCGKECASASQIRSHALYMVDDIHPDSKEEIIREIRRIPVKKRRDETKIRELQKEVKKLTSKEHETEQREPTEEPKDKRGDLEKIGLV